MSIIKYKLKRTKRKTVQLSIKKGELSILAPMRISIEQIENFIVSKKDWVEECIKNDNAKKEKFKHLTQCQYCLINGGLIEIDFMDNINTKIKNGVLYINTKYFNNNQKIISQIISYYKKHLWGLLVDKLTRLSQQTGLKYASITLSTAQKKWGSCDTLGNIKLNFRLLMLPQSLQEYVIIHELCHTIEHNHSKAFWACVKKFCPQYNAFKKQLKEWSIINDIY